MKLLGTLDELINLEFNRLTKLSNMSASTIMQALQYKFPKYTFKRVYIVPDSFNGSALDWEKHNGLKF